MKLELAILTVLLVPLASGQQDYTGSPEVIEQPEPETETAVCGDGICQPEIRGVCPQDCVDGYNESSNNTVEASDSGQSPSGFSNIEIVTGALTIISGLLLSVLLFKKRNNKDDREDNLEDRNRDLEREMRKRLRQGRSLKSVRNDMRENGFSDDDIRDAEQYISDGLLNSSENR